MKTASMVAQPFDLDATRMDRRKFIRVGSASGVALLVGVAAGAPAAEGATIASASSGSVPHLGRLFRAGTHGRILVSDNNGLTWQVHADFGPDQTVRSVEQRAEGVVAKMGLGAQSFELKLHKMGHCWLSLVL